MLRHLFSRPRFWPFAFLWLALVSASLTYIVRKNYDDIQAIAKSRAATTIQTDLLYRQWAAAHGGVYVPLSEKAPPNPHLAHLPHRDVVTQDGVKLTLINPAYMTRQVHELGKTLYGIQSHLTALKPTRPENAPDSWERAALETITKTRTEISEVVSQDNRLMLRQIKPFVVEQSCLKCHAREGYHLGEIKGGISSTIPLDSVFPSFQDTALTAILYHIAFFAIGIGLLYLLYFINSRNHEEQNILLNSLASAILLLDSNGRIRYANSSAREVLGFSMDFFQFPLLSELPARFETKEGTPVPLSSLPVFETLKSQASIFNVHYRMFTKMGKPRWVTITSVPLIQRLPWLAKGAAFVLRDITEETELLQEKEILQKQIFQTNKFTSIGTLAAGMAHEINNPLAIILGKIDLLKDILAANQMSKKTEALFLSIDKAAQRITTIIKGLESFSAEGQNEARTGSFEIAPVIHKALSTVSSFNKNPNLQITHELEESLPILLGNSNLFHQTLVHILRNSLDATLTRENPWIRVVAKRKDHAVLLEILDNGVGLPAHQLEHVFDPFFTNKQVGQGIGLGLPFARSVIESMGGTIQFQSQENNGALVSMTFPVIKE